MQLIDIMPTREWALFEALLHNRFQMNCTVYNTSGTGITARPNWCNQLCPVIKSNTDSLAAICATGNQNFMARAKRDRTAVIGECDAGLIKIAVPIFVDGTFLGTAGGCGRLPVGGEVETFLIAKTTGLDETEVAALCRGLNSMTTDQAGEMADFIDAHIVEFLKRWDRYPESYSSRR